MHGLIAVVLVAALAAGAPAAGGSAADPGNVVSPVDVPGAQVTFSGIEMARPDRDPDKVICRYESQPDTRFKKRNCAQRRDRQALEALEQEHLMVNQRGFCGGGQLC